MPNLIVAIAGGNRVSHELAGEFISIGCAAGNSVVLDDPTVSPRHAEVRVHEDSYQLRDLGSAQGTRVNGELVSEATLRPGDHIEFGAAETWFEAAEGKRPSSPRPAEVSWEAAVHTARPVDFVNASPFRTRRKQRDPVGTAIFAAAIIAALVLLTALIAVLRMQSP